METCIDDIRWLTKKGVHRFIDSCQAKAIWTFENGMLHIAASNDEASAAAGQYDNVSRANDTLVYDLKTDPDRRITIHLRNRDCEDPGLFGRSHVHIWEGLWEVVTTYRLAPL
jgi:hypothetical protein